MAGVTLDVKWDEGQAPQALRQVLTHAEDPTPLLQELGEALLISHRQRFDREEAPDGSKWAPLADSTLRRKMLAGVRRGKDGRRSLTTAKGNTKAGAIKALAAARILVQSGDLRDSLRYQVEGRTLLFGTDRIYGATQQFGDPDRHIPARVFVGLSKADQVEAGRIAEDYLAPL